MNSTPIPFAPGHGRLFAAALLAALCAGPSLNCRATGFAPNPDQSYVAPVDSAYSIGYVSPTQPVEQAQTFTVGESGYLTGLNVQVSIFDSLPGLTSNSLVVSLRTTASGTPGVTSLANVAVPASMVPTNEFRNQPAWVSLDLSADHIAVTSGEMLAIVLDSAAPANGTEGYAWLAGSTASSYPAGSAWGHVVSSPWNQDTFDFGFQDFVTPVPEPSSLALAITGAICLLGLYRKIARSA